MEINSILLFTLNILAAILLKNLHDLKKDFEIKISDVTNFTRGTRRKLDQHCENFALHRVQ